MKKSIGLSVSDIVFIMLINVKMPTILGILTFMRRINFVLSLVEHEKSFISFTYKRPALEQWDKISDCHDIIEKLLKTKQC